MRRYYGHMVFVILVALAVAMLIADGPWGPG